MPQHLQRIYRHRLRHGMAPAHRGLLSNPSANSTHSFKLTANKGFVINALLLTSYKYIDTLGDSQFLLLIISPKTSWSERAKETNTQTTSLFWTDSSSISDVLPFTLRVICIRPKNHQTSHTFVDNIFLILIMKILNELKENHFQSFIFNLYRHLSRPS